MKTEHLVLLGIGAYLLYSRSPASGVPTTYNPNPGTQPRPTGSSSGGGSGSGAGSGAGAGAGAGSGGSPPATFNPTSGYYTCADGTEVNDPSLCSADMTGYVTCWDGTQVNDASLCSPQIPMDSMDPCDPNSVAYDWSQCGSDVGSGYDPYTYYDSGNPCDPNSTSYDWYACGEGSL